MRFIAAVLAGLGALVSSALADSVVVFNEIMYHPLTNEPALEWVELQNQHSVDVDISGWRVDGAIHFTFAEGTIMPRGGYLVVAGAPASFPGLANVVGPFTGRLGNGGDHLLLRNRNDRVIDEITYGTESDWPVAPDGAGPSLARRARDRNGADPANWQASAQIGGTPGAENFPVRPPTVATNTLVSGTGTWHYDDSGTDLGITWRQPDYDDQDWRSGLGLFYLTDIPLALPKNTPLAPGRITYYFRTSFVFNGDRTRVALQARPFVDDGMVVYLNGAEIFRANMASGVITYDSLAIGQVGNANWSDAIPLPASLLQSGRNVLAVEVHQGPNLVAYPDAVLASGPVGYWRLGESGGIAYNSAVTAGQANGTYSGIAAANLTDAGPRPSDMVGAQSLVGFEGNNPATRFAGNGDGGNDVVTIPDTGNFNFAGSHRFTLEAWVNAAPTQEEGAAVIAKGTGGGGEQFAIDIVGGTYRFYGWDGGSPNAATVVGSSIGPNNTWQYVVAAYDQPAGRMRLYINGVERGSAAPRPSLVNNTHDVSIGSRQLGSGAYDLNFDGRIDEVAIYNRALSTNEILAHFNAAFTNNAAAGPDTNDAVFGLELATTEIVPEPTVPQLAFNEFSSATNADFWIELINPGTTNMSLSGCTLARFGGATNREYALPALSLAPGQLLQVTKAQMGFGADPGDRLVLYGPGRARVFDALVAKREPRARHPDGDGPWLFPSALSPGTSNQFVFRDELVINEIMYHHLDELPIPATYSPTNQLINISNLWRYHAEGVDLGTSWRAPGYDDSSWPASNAVFYAPTNFFVLPAPKNTFLPVTNSLGERIITFYFRTQFQFQGETNGLRLGLNPIVDDGAVFYLNGVEVYRLAMPAVPAAIVYGSLATSNVGVPGFSGPLLIPSTSLVQGLNTLAVEVHQVAAISSDMDFGTELLAWYELTPFVPFRESPESWIELYNRSTHPVNLAGWRLDEGIDFRFASGQSIGPGGYLVVAKDVAYLRSLYPGLSVVGPFTNRLSRHSDRIVLKDPDNNPADQVRYFAGGRWPEYADGGGSSLELRDPWADRTQPEAWAASDESSKSAWQTFSWRGIAAAAQSGEPNLWREFALCLVDGGGEVLLDDFSIVERPATTPKQLLANGDFSGGSAAHWRFLGNHQRSRVEPEPGNPANYVLHLVASGAGEYQGNQIETTLTNNASIANGTEYEISFRAKWLAGHRKLNSRLYFNRLARTVDLAAPTRNGTPGAPNSRLQPGLGPTFAQFQHSPTVPPANQPVTVQVAAGSPNSVADCVLFWSVNGGSWQNAPMTRDPEALLQPDLRASSVPYLIFNAQIPGAAPASIVQFYVQATDDAGASAMFPARGPTSHALYVVQDGQAGPASGLHNFRMVMTSADANYLHTPTNTLSNELLGCTVIYDEQEVFYDAGVRLKGSFVGRNVARVGFHVEFPDDHLFRGVHSIVSVDRSQHTQLGGVGDIVLKHVAAHAGGIPEMQDDLARCLAPLPSYDSMSVLRLTGFDNDWLDAQFQNGAEGAQHEVEVLRWNLSTVGGNPENPKNVGNESTGTGYANLEVANYGNNPEAYRWFLLKVNDREQDDFSRGIAFCQLFSLAGTAFEAQAQQVLDLDEWLRVMAYQQLIGPADAWFTGANIHNFRIYARPQDQRVLYMPWDWDSAFQIGTTTSLQGSGSITKLLGNPNRHRAYYHHLYDLVTSTFNSAYMSRWTTHYGAIASQDLSGILSYIGGRATFVLSQLPTATTFAITNNAGADFESASNSVTLTGTAPISVASIEVNGVPYALTWLSDSVWRLTVPLQAGANLLSVQGVDALGQRPANRLDTITVTNNGPSALQPVVINEWMADNAAPGGFPDPADGLYQDWIELFNPNDAPVNLGGYHLTDNLSQPTKWQIPAPTLIAPHGFLLVWADEDGSQNSTAPDGGLHANFKLSAGGELIALIAPDGVARQHVVAFGPQFQNVSQGLFPDGNTNAYYFMTNWTPRASNVLGLPLAPRFTSIVLEDSTTVTLTCGAIPGRTYHVEFKDTLDAPQWTPLGAPITPTAPTLTARDTGPFPRQRFYRVRLE
ncbi:MAG TPA: lamin tail domain-containing protein [Verrucomicrobiae bacterium]|nr:lamin tail domain-containing protein [Verrucomicrobiae bacterium]